MARAISSDMEKVGGKLRGPEQAIAVPTWVSLNLLSSSLFLVVLTKHPKLSNFQGKGVWSTIEATTWFEQRDSAVLARVPDCVTM